MANQTDGENKNPVTEGLELLEQVEPAIVAPDGTIICSNCEANLISVDVADVDLLLGFSDGTFTIIPNGALDAITNPLHPVLFSEGDDLAADVDPSGGMHRSTLGDLFKMVGITRVAEGGRLSVVSENVDTQEPVEEPEAPEPPGSEPAPSNDAPMISSPTLNVELTSGTTFSGKGPGTGATDPNDQYVASEDPVVQEITPRPPVYKATPETIDLSDPTIILDPNITADDIVNIAESSGSVGITGRVGGSAEVGDMVTLAVNGKTYFGQVLADKTFSIDVAGSDLVADDDMTIDASVTTVGADNPGVDSEGYGVDVTAPVTPGVALANDTGTDNSDGITKDPTLDLSGIESGAVVEYSVNGGGWSDTYNPVAGDNTVEVRQTDVAGNTSGTGTLAFTLDLSAVEPTVSIDPVAGDGVINLAESTGVAVTGTVGGDAQVGDTVTLTVDGGTYSGEVLADKTFSIDVPFSALDSDADKTIDASITTELFGLTGTASGSQGYSVDITPPLAPGVSLANDTTDGRPGNDGDGITSDGTLALTGIEVGATVEYSIDGGVTWSDSFTASEGNNTVHVRQTDAAGNTGNSANLTFELDTTAPTPTITSINSVTADGVVNIAEAGGTVTVTGTVGGEVKEGDTVTLTLSSDTFTGIYTGVVLGDMSFSIDVDGSALVADADSTLQATVTTTDGAGNAGTSLPVAAGYDVDITAPQVTGGQSYSYAENQAEGTVVAAVAATDNIGVVDYRIVSGNDEGYFAIDSTGQITLTAAGAAAASNDYEALPNSFALGVEAQDAAGNWSVSEKIAISVTDENDNAPEITTDAAQAVAENSAFSVALTSTDVDTVGTDPASFSITGGADAGLFSIDVSGNLTMAAQDRELPVDAGTSPADNVYEVQVTANDGVNETVKTIKVTVTDVNEAPTDITLSASVVAENDSGAIIGTLEVADQDLGDSHIFVVDDSRFEVVAGELKLKDGESLDFESEPSVDITITATDSGGLSYSKTVNLSVTDQNDLPVAQAVAESASEDGPSIIVTADFTDEDLSDSHTFSVDTTGTLGTVTNNLDGTFRYDPNGQFEFLAEGATATDSFTYTVDDGNGGTSSATVTITIAGQNDAPVALAVSGIASEDGPAIAIAADFSDDAGDTHTFSVDATGTLGTVANNLDGTFTYDPTGNFESLAVGETATDTFNYTVVDSFGLTSTKSVSVTIHGTNDGPTITAVSTDDVGDVTEDADPTTLSTTGTITFNDVDLTDTHSTSVTADGSNALGGTLTMGAVAEDGASESGTVGWTYSVDNSATQSLGAGDTVQETFTVTISDGNDTVTQEVTITVHGENDGAVIGGEDSGSVSEDVLVDGSGNITDSGKLTITDVDTGEAAFNAGTVGGDYGLLTIDSSGNWTYAADNSQAVIQSLAPGETLTDTLTVSSVDGTTHDVVITINGTEDIPPTVVSVTMSDSATPLKIGDTRTVTVTFSEAVNFSNADIDVPNGTLSSFSPNGDQTVWTATFAPTVGIEDPENVITVHATYTDMFGNVGFGETSSNYAIDTVAPEVNIISITSDSAGAATDDFVTTDRTLVIDGSYDASDTATLTVEFNGETYTLGASPELTVSGADAWRLDVQGTSLNDGPYDAVVTATDAAGNVGSHTQTIVVDNAAPAVGVTDISDDSAAADFVTSDDTLVIRGSYDEADTDVLSVTFNGTTYTLGSSVQLTDTGADAWQLDLSGEGGLDDASYDVTVTAVDEAGNTDSATQTIVIDSSKPVPPSITGVTDDVAPVTGNVANGGYTNDTRPALVGTAEADSTVTIYDGGSPVDTVQADSEGNWSYPLTADLSDGSTHTFTVTATDQAGNVSDLSPGYVVHVDTSVAMPTISLDVDALSDDTLGDYTIGNLEGSASVQYSTNSTNGVDGDWEPVKPSLGAAGDYRIWARQVDAAGNISVGILLAFTYGSLTDDTLAATSNNIIVGRDGGDILTGGAGNDTLYGDAGNDELSGAGGTNTLYGGSGSDTFYGGSGSDTFDGGADNSDSDTVDYSAAGSGADVSASLNSGSGTQGIASDDSYVAIENLTGGGGNDTLEGDSRANVLRGGDGNDTLYGLGGNDTLYGEAGDDELYGGDGDDELYGGDGNDLLEGMDGNDTLVGGVGDDTASYAGYSSGTAITASLTDGSGGDGFYTDTYDGIENLTGGAGDDSLTGDENPNILTGGAGNDSLYGMVGDDILYGGDGIDTLEGGAGDDILEGGTGMSDILRGGDGSDTASYENAGEAVLVNMTNGWRGGEAFGDTFESIENLTGSDFADWLVGDANDNILTGGKLGDTLDGGSGGSDTASYANAETGLTASLANTAENTGDALGDFYANIDNLTGSDHADTLYGNDNANILKGGGGSDSLYGLGGDDTLHVNQGEDADVDGGAGIDTVVMEGLGAAYELVDLANITANIEELNISDGASTELTVTSQDILDMVSDPAGAGLTIKVDDGDSLHVTLAEGQTMTPGTFDPDATSTPYTISDDGGTVAVIHWEVVS